MQNAKNNKSVSKKSFLLLILGFAFFINPVPLGLDLIPDVFGCIMIYFGLTQLSFFDGEVETSRRFVFYLFIVEFFKLLFMRSVVQSEISSNRLLAVTVFSILQAFLYIVIIRKLFGGISYFAMRNNANETLKLCDDVTFTTYLSFFVRIAATLVPELVALFDVLLTSGANVGLDFDKIEFIESIVSAKIIVVVLLNLVSLICSISWFISFAKLMKLLRKELGSELDKRYVAEYSSRPEMVRPKKLRYGIYAIYVSLFFALDITFDRIRIVPASALFLGLFIASFMFKGIGDLKKVRLFAPFAFITLLGAEIHHVFLVPYGAVYLYETPILTVISGAFISVVSAAFGLICIRLLLLSAKDIQKNLGGSAINIGKAWVSYCILVVLWCGGYVVPYFYSYFSTARFFAACIFIWQTTKIFAQINEEEQERFIMYGR